MNDANGAIHAAELVADLGFLVQWDLPTESHDAVLAVAMRAIPTERHFDPELIAFWQTDEKGRGRRHELTLATPPHAGSFSWGTIELYDRFGVTNAFISFGGGFALERTDPDTAVVAFRSPGPIFRRGGHSQRYDLVAAEIGAFFARLMVPIDFRPGAEQAIATASPLERYAAFLHYDMARMSANELVREAYGIDGRLVRAEAQRVRSRRPEAWGAGSALLERIGFAI